MLRQVLKGLGRAGGHGRMAGGQVELKDGNRVELEVQILQRFLEAAGIDDHAGAPLVAALKALPPVQLNAKSG
jgi:hypothetical protein